MRSAENPSTRVAWPGCGRGRGSGRTTGSLPHTTVGRQVRLKCRPSPRAGCSPRVRLKRPYLFLVLLSNDQRDKSGGSYDQQPFPKPTSNLKPQTSGHVLQVLHHCCVLLHCMSFGLMSIGCQSRVLSNICAQSARELVLKVPSHPLMWTHVNEHLDVVHAGQVVRPGHTYWHCTAAVTPKRSSHRPSTAEHDG